jgi:transglutaminase-like putative cysteine protease
MISSNGRMAVIAAAAAFLSVTPLVVLTTDWKWLAPAAISIGLVMGIGYGLRRLRLPAPLVYVLQPIALIYWLGVLIAGDVAWYGIIPNTEWVDRLRSTLQNGIEASAEHSAPIAVDEYTGVLLLLVGGAGIVAWLVDVLVAGLRAPVVAGAPLAACYVVAAIVTEGDVAWVAFVPPAAGYLGLLVTDRRSQVMAWGRSATSSRRRSGVPQADSLVRTGRRVGAVAVTAAVAIPALVPLLTDGLLPTGGGGGGGGGGQIIRTDNPIVSIQDNLNMPDDVVVLTYQTTATPPNYLRLAIDDEFDGREWRPSSRVVPESQNVDGGLPEPPGLDRDSVETVRDVEYDITATEEIALKWLPLPYPATAIDINGDWRYHDATLDVVANSEDTQSDFEYSVEALAVQPTFEELSAAGSYPSELDPLTELPDDFSPEVIAAAQAITEGASSDIERAQMLQAFFREGDFEYDTTVDLRESQDGMEEFLNIRRGFCVQFSTTMTAMARSLDIPARVAVGWVRGDREGTEYIVRANDAHAWPELYFEGVGWVPFEPTPAARDGAVRPAWSIPPSDDPDETAGPTSDPTSTASFDPRDLDQREDRDTDLGAGGSGFDAGSRWPQVLLIAAVAGVLISLPRGAAWARQALRWRRAGHDPASRAEAAWAELRDAVRDARLHWDDADTPRMIGSRIASDTKVRGDDRELLTHIVATTEKARYARLTPDEPELQPDSAMLRRDILRSQPIRTRVAAFLWPAAVRDLGNGLSKRGGKILDWVDGLRAVVRMRVLRQPE